MSGRHHDLLAVVPVCVCVYVYMYDYHIAVSIKTLAPATATATRIRKAAHTCTQAKVQGREELGQAAVS